MGDLDPRLLRAQHETNVAFAIRYEARAPARVGAPSRRRVLVSGFGRFLDVDDNASGRIVSHLVPSAPYPSLPPRAADAVDPPAPHVVVGTVVKTLGAMPDVELCGVLLPVFWDLAAIVLAREIDRFQPDVVLMNGVAGDRQPLWLELGSTNAAEVRVDGSGLSHPAVAPGAEAVPIVPTMDIGAPLPSLLSWEACETAARLAAAARAHQTEEGARLDSILQGVVLAGFPRPSNRYLCNQITFVTSWLMAEPGREARLLRSAHASGMPARVAADLRHVPRAFLHWPRDLRGRHVTAGAEILAAVGEAQLMALDRGEIPTLGGDGPRRFTPRDGATRRGP